MNIYLYELKASRKSCLTWIITSFVILLVTLSFYPIFNEGMEEFMALINNLPKEIQALFGMNADTIKSILGYYSFILLFIILCGTIEAMMLGLNVLSKEIREKAADFLLAKPVSRIKIVTSKLLANLSWLIISNILYLIGFYFILNIFTNNSFPFNTYLLLTLTIFLLQILFFTIGSFFAVIIPKIKTIIPISLGTVFGFYLLSTFTDDKLRIISIFKYFDTANILITSSYELKYLLILIIISGLLVTGTYLIYNKKDIIV